MTFVTKPEEFFLKEQFLDNDIDTHYQYKPSETFLKGNGVYFSVKEIAYE